MNARTWGALIIGILLGGSAVKLIDRPSNASERLAPVVKEEQPAFSRPTAEEAYRLQDDCSKKGRAVLQHNLIGSALSQEQVSEYSPVTNRCYVLLQVHAADLSQSGKYENSEYLYDGQTDALLAWHSVNPDHSISYLGFNCSDGTCVADKIDDCMQGKKCHP